MKKFTPHRNFRLYSVQQFIKVIFLYLASEWLLIQVILKEYNLFKNKFPPRNSLVVLEWQKNAIVVAKKTKDRLLEVGVSLVAIYKELVEFL